jgi:probable HAF family extracellular repeat protein
LFGALVALCLQALPATAQDASLQGLGYLPTTPPNGPESRATAVSADGTVVVGFSNSGSGQQAFRWSGGAMAGLGYIAGGNSTIAYAISADGNIIVGHGNSATTPNYAFKWSGGTLSAVASSDCGGQGPFAYGVSSDGSVIVGNTDGTTAPNCFPGRAVQWLNGGAFSLLMPTPSQAPPSGLARGTNADGSVIVGEVGASTSASCNPCTQAFRWTGNTITMLGDLGGNYSSAYAASSNGLVVVGTAAVDNVNSQPFRWTAATGLVGLGGQGVYSIAYATNADGSVVVGKVGNPGRAFRWTAATGLQYLDDLLTAAGASVTGWSLTAATGVSADGSVIVGYGSSATGGQAWIAHLPLSSAADCVFNWGEDQYPSLLSPKRPTTQTFVPYIYRYYSTSNAYLGTSISNSHLYFVGTASGNVVVDLGLITDWYKSSGCQ